MDKNNILNITNSPNKIIFSSWLEQNTIDSAENLISNIKLNDQSNVIILAIRFVDNDFHMIDHNIWLDENFGIESYYNLDMVYRYKDNDITTSVYYTLWLIIDPAIAIMLKLQFPTDILSHDAISSQ